MFVDASAIVAILTCEPEADRLVDALDAAERASTSAIAVFEATLGIRRKRHASVQEAHADVVAFLAEAGIETVPIGHAQAQSALDAFSRYGKGTGHPAQLDLGGCFAYAVAATHGIPLLFKGRDFDKTDIGSAVDLSS